MLGKFRSNNKHVKVDNEHNILFMTNVGKCENKE